jgi:hypothetical protein
MPAQAIAEDEVNIPPMLVMDAVAEELLSASGKKGSELQSAIDKDLTPQSRELPGTSVTIHLRNSSERRGTTSNVVGWLEGSDPKLAPETILITAHHDHDGYSACAAGQGGIDQHGTPTAADGECKQVWHGADDNGSGTVGVVNLARAFAANGSRPNAVYSAPTGWRHIL